MNIVQLSSGVLAELPVEFLAVLTPLSPNTREGCYCFDVTMDFADSQLPAATGVLQRCLEDYRTTFKPGSWYINLIQHRTGKVVPFLFCPSERYVRLNLKNLRSALDLLP